jgi:hypothetical protein
MKSHLENIKAIIEKQNQIIKENKEILKICKSYLGK